MTNKNAVLSRRVAQYLLFVSCLLPAWALGDVAAVVESVERLPRIKRLAAYEAALGICRRGQAWASGFKGHARSLADAFLANSWFDSAGHFCANHGRPAKCESRSGVNRRFRGAVGYLAI